MKTVKGMENLANILTEAANKSVVPVTPAAPTPEKVKKMGTVPVFLRLPEHLHAAIDAEAIARTKETGRGVSVQMIILEKLAKP